MFAERETLAKQMVAFCIKKGLSKSQVESFFGGLDIVRCISLKFKKTSGGKNASGRALLEFHTKDAASGWMRRAVPMKGREGRTELWLKSGIGFLRSHSGDATVTYVRYVTDTCV